MFICFNGLGYFLINFFNSKEITCNNLTVNSIYELMNENIKIEFQLSSNDVELNLKRNNLIKDLKKLDSELVQRNEGILGNPTLRNVFKPFLKII